MKKCIVYMALLLAILTLSGCGQTSTQQTKSVREQNEENVQKAYDKYEDGEDYWDSVEPNIQALDEESVYWVPKGKSYHSTKDCVALLRSKTILNGTLEQAIYEGKDDPCSKCVGD